MLVDPAARRFSYLCLSLTDACAFRCVYGLPHGFHKTEAASLLTVDALTDKADGHLLSLGRFGDTKNFAQLGG